MKWLAAKWRWLGDLDPMSGLAFAVMSLFVIIPVEMFVVWVVWRVQR